MTNDGAITGEVSGAASENDDGAESGVVLGVVRHRRHQFPARTRVVKVRYDDREHALVAGASARAGLTVAGYLAGAGLAAAGEGPPPSQAADRELRRYAVNLNQAVATLHSTGDAPAWLSRAVAGAHQAVLSIDAATRRVAGRPG
jgi:hypothetical protein